VAFTSDEDSSSNRTILCRQKFSIMRAKVQRSPRCGFEKKIVLSCRHPDFGIDSYRIERSSHCGLSKLGSTTTAQVQASEEAVRLCLSCSDRKSFDDHLACITALKKEPLDPKAAETLSTVPEKQLRRRIKNRQQLGRYIQLQTTSNHGSR
jgi:hypothetical protein